VRTPAGFARRYFGVVNRLQTFFANHGLDALIVVLALAAAVAIVTAPDQDRPDGVRAVFEVAAVAVMILTLLLRGRAPLIVPAATWLMSAALSFVDGSLIVGLAPVSIAGMVAAVLLGSLPDERQARVGLAVVLVSATTVVYNDPTHTVANLFFIPVLFAVGWLVGLVLHERTGQTEAAEQRAAQAERERESAGRVAVAEERARIARELHDVVAHAVSVMVLQVGVLRHRMPPEQAENREALRNVEEAGRAALAEMRRLLDAMTRDEDRLELAPQPGLDKVNTLLRDVRAAGLDVRLEVHGDPVTLSPGLDLSAYRIVQEGLTNALKHAHAQHAEVHIRYGAGVLELEIRDDGRGPAASDGLGHGLVGIGERVKIYGGDMTAGATETGGFALCARLPMDGAVKQ
jgi:signal transduction histidine kinase